MVWEPFIRFLIYLKAWVSTALGPPLQKKKIEFTNS